MASMPSASREEVSELLGEADAPFVERVLDTGASVDEIGEALDDLEGRLAEARHEPSSARVAQVREILAELFIGSAASRTFSLRGVPVTTTSRS